GTDHGTPRGGGIGGRRLPQRIDQVRDPAGQRRPAGARAPAGPRGPLPSLPFEGLHRLRGGVRGQAPHRAEEVAGGQALASAEEGVMTTRTVDPLDMTLGAVLATGAIWLANG